MPEWFEEGLEADHVTEITAKGWNKPLTPEIARDIVSAHRAATKMIGIPPEQLLRLPKDATDPAYASVLDRVLSMSVPKTPEEYKFDGIKYKDGSALDPEDQAFVRDLAVRHKLPLSVATGLAQELATRAETMYEGSTLAEQTARGAATAALQGTWGAEYDRKSHAAAQTIDALKQLGVTVPDAAAMGSEAYLAHMNGLVALNSQLSEAAVLRGGGRNMDPLAGMSPESARASYDELSQNPDWRAKAVTHGTEENKQWVRLTQLMAQAVMGAQTRRPDWVR